MYIPNTRETYVWLWGRERCTAKHRIFPARLVRLCWVFENENACFIVRAYVRNVWFLFGLRLDGFHKKGSLQRQYAYENIPMLMCKVSVICFPVIYKT